MNTPDQLEVLIKNQRRTVRWYMMFATGLFLMGLVLIGTGFVLHFPPESDYLKVLLGVAGTFVSSVCTFPLKEVITCRDRLSIFELLKIQISEAKKFERDRIDSLVWDVLKKFAGG